MTVEEGSFMKCRHLPLLVLLSLTMGAVMTVQVDVTTQIRPGTTNLPRTPWGDPDLQGVWNNNTVVPLERPEALGDKDFLSDEEVAQRLNKYRN